ncbi:uroporphyrinogen-III synthase [Arthrobacter sp. JZ12]|uniref:uroporphyrinogen-III synthase n=1 Tax=Arthrobacter sp. JZ12 TaxID=2654190 RepID=UPI002B4593D9|nr:uroporphyrinogen-III synthase [Arthrobacter sp. JZ12]WRH24490.1 uroporphyrinogen-III synthase [Arthrobacter sp. JZ12]
MTAAVTTPAVTQSAAAEVADGSLSGFRIGVTSDRRAGDLIDALERRGATVLHAPALKIAPVAADLPLLEDTRRIIAAQPDYAVVTTAYGLRRWSEAADAAGLGDALLSVLSDAKIYVRGPKARGAVRAAGLNDVGISHDETTASLVNMMLGLDLRGKKVAVQLHGYTDYRQLDRLRQAGAEVLTATPYRWVKPAGSDQLPRLIEAVCNGGLDVVTFTSAPAVDAVLSTASELGCREAFIQALRGPVAAAVVGPVTAQPLVEAGVSPLIPERYRMGALIRLVCEFLGQHRVMRYPSAFGLIELRGKNLRINGTAVELAPAPMSLFRALLEANGAVMSREQLARVLAGDAGEHALDMTISRLRKSLPDAGLVATVIKRGYRLQL